MTIIKPDWPAPENIFACTTTRHSWGQSKDQQQCSPDRQQLQALLSLPSNPFWLNQIHSNKVMEVSHIQHERDADASFTHCANEVCIVLTADCLPLLVCDKKGESVAAIHAGWRGLAAGVVENTIKAMKTKPDDLMVWLGPAIGPQNFEVGNDVYQDFTREDEDSKCHFTAKKEGKWHADLYGLAKLRLNRLGITDIYGGNFCTYDQANDFFSYRRDGGKTGRMATLVWIGKNLN